MATAATAAVAAATAAVAATAAAAAAAADPTTTSRFDATAPRRARAPGAIAVAVVCLVLWLTASHRQAEAGWPTPAGGASASGAPEVLFTFDDGPHRRFTPAILDELARRDIEAIFFWVAHRLTRGAWATEQQALVARAVREGHLVANHTATHPDLCLVKEPQAASEIDETTQILKQFSALPIVLFRAPYGAWCRRLEHMVAERQLIHVYWDIDPKEWEHHSVKRTVQLVTRKLDRLEGRAIVLMHDTQFVTVRALPQILDWIDEENERRRARGVRPPIRIISGSQLIAEHIDAKMPRWVQARARDAIQHLGDVASRLIP